MENSIYNSLAEKLKQSGILQDEKSPDYEENVFLKGLKENASIEEEKKEETEEPTAETKPQKKRINRYDLELIQDENTTSSPASPFLILKRFLNFKEAKINSGSLSAKERFFNRFFPRLYKIKIAKDAINRLTELDIDTKTLLDKTIPYGESEARYNDLVKYLNYATEIQKKLNKSFK